MEIILTSQRELWHDYLKWMPSEVQDIHFWPEMMYPYEVTGQGRGGLLVDEHNSGRMMLPLLKKDGKFFHPFNFGGPISTPEYRGKIEINGPVYCTLNPFFTKEQQPLLHVTEYQKETVWLDLTQAPQFRQTTKHMIAKAEKAGAEFRAEAVTQPMIEEFCEMYNSTMDRAQAADHWRFSFDWFRSFLSCLEGHVTLCMVYINGKPESGCILLHGYGTCYYHFAASHRNHPSIGVNHYMVAKAAEFAQGLKCKRFHLGGGVQPRDGLFTFKSGFSDLTLPVYKFRPELLKELKPPDGVRPKLG